ncbi:hypothetical protein DFP72DRAFT_1148879 [Ephemerocybe angulata]|uniref:Uncharacterized protein n=1 Tax=Ephemerocybe angulata TaxID=980116 RepID=A0A8H6MBK0_9AGAR|nr:hypothetical protein DFP72DRAFT_1148879 [Tulosesus angulatus]
MPATHRPFGLARPALSDLSIPDSEPERVEMRVKIGTSSRALKDLDVIEILDSDSEPSGSDSLPAANEPTKKAATRPKKATLELSSEFTDKDMDKVLKCISCDARWTARKSATQKVQHMRACCKKAKLSQETIDILLRQAIQASTPAAPVADPPAASPYPLHRLPPPRAKEKKSPTTESPETLNLLKLIEVCQNPHRPSSSVVANWELHSGQLLSLATMILVSEEELSDPSPTKKKGQPRFFPSPGHSTDLETIELAPALAAVSLRGEPSRVGGSTLPGRKSPSAKKKVAKARAPRTKAVYDIAWEEKLRGKILDDKDLYLRILRLEPILLDVFIALVSEPGEGKPTSKLKKSLSSYLDKEGIVFYTLERWR